MLTMMFAVGDTMEAPQSAYYHCAACGAGRSNLSGSARDCFASLAMTTGRRFCFVLGPPLLRLPAAADLLRLALVLDLGDRAQHLEAELAVELAVELLDGVEDRMHRIPCGGRHEVRMVVGPIGVVPCLDELLVGSIVEIGRIMAHHDGADGGLAHVLQ